MRLQDGAKSVSVLVGSFRRAGKGHAFIVTVDHHDGGAASDIFFVDAAHLPEALKELREEGLVVTSQAVDPAEFRWYVEDALDAQAEHDPDPSDLSDPSAELEFGPSEDEGPPYQVLAVLVRARLTALPPARKPAGAQPRTSTTH